MAKNLFQKRFQEGWNSQCVYQQGESLNIPNETECVTGSKDVPLNTLSNVSTSGSQLDGVPSVFAIEPALWKSGQLNSSKIVNFRDGQNTFEDLSHVQDYRPVCKRYPLGPNAASVAISVFFGRQIISEEPLIESANVPLNSIKDTNAIAGPSQMQFSKDLVKRKLIYHFCNKEYKYKFQLRKHFLRHAGEKRLACDFCGKRFTKKGNLTRHIRIHTGEKPFKCDECKKGFTQRAHLDQHIGINSAAKPLKRDVCEKEFNHKINLGTHCRKHAGEKPFKCFVCKKGFTKKACLNHHSRIHAGEKNFKCNVCSKEFFRKSNLKSHYRKHTGEKRFECAICKMRYSWKYQLLSHYETHGDERI